MQETQLKTLVKIYFDSQKFRVLAGNRLSHVQNIDVTETPAGITEYMESKGIASEEDLTTDDLKAIARAERARKKKEKDYASKDGFENTSKRMLIGYSSIENDIMKEMTSELNRYPISRWLLAHRGIGTVFAAGLIAYIGDIEKFGTVSKLWQYAGMGVVEICQDCGKRVVRVDRGAWIQHTAERLEWANSKVIDQGKRKSPEELEAQAKSYLCSCGSCNTKVMGQRRIQGQLADFNPDFKKLCYLIGDQFIKQRESPYRKLYDQYRLEYETRPDLIAEMQGKKGKGAVKVKGEMVEVKGTAHINAMARRKAVKIFLSHLWEEWRTIQGLPTPAPYSFAVLGHADKIERMRIEYK
jgi:hypothetical protein